jgi:hypothetical protein
MHTIQSARQLKIAFFADALFCAATAAGHLLDGKEMALQFALPHQLLLGTGIFLALHALLLTACAMRDRVWCPLVWLIILGGVGWFAIGLDLVLFNIIEPNPGGLAYLTAHAIVVLALAFAEYAGLKTSGASDPGGHLAPV